MQPIQSGKDWFQVASAKVWLEGPGTADEGVPPRAARRSRAWSTATRRTAIVDRRLPLTSASAASRGASPLAL